MISPLVVLQYFHSFLPWTCARSVRVGTTSSWRLCVVCELCTGGHDALSHLYPGFSECAVLLAIIYRV